MHAFTAITNNKGEITLERHHNVQVVEGLPWSFFAFALGGLRIITKPLWPERKIKGEDVEEIIEKIHKIRFSSKERYVISGGHFKDLYIRNLGIFYSNLLTDTASIPDLRKRQQIALKTVALQLALLEKVKREPTTFTALSSRIYVAKNIYTRASDSLYSILYTLTVLRTHKATKSFTNVLLVTYTATLKRLLLQYEKEIIDALTGLVKKDITLSSARDGVRRQSAFYDNVIAWKTLSLAKELGIIVYPKGRLREFHQKILAASWDDKEGIFLDDLSEESKAQHTFSADSFIVLSTGFLNPSNLKDREKLMRMVSYVEKNKLDTPFPLRYAKKNNRKKQYFWVNLAVQSYMGKTIWSHWGMEYIKALILLGRKARARYFINKYEENIKKYGGYPELYHADGRVYKTTLYRSILHTGWVINFEETKQMLVKESKG